MKTKHFILVILSTLLVACSAGIEQLAADGDWREVGYRDGIKGHHPRSGTELKSLGQVDQAEYDQGYLEGIEEYCNPDFAYQIGLSGQYYEGVCEGTKEAQRFRMEWQRGWNDAN